MKSHEALSRSINRDTAAHAKALHKSVSLVNKWCEPCIDFSDSGAHNPLDRIETIIETSLRLGMTADQALSPVFYLGQRFNFVPLLVPVDSPHMPDVSRHLNQVISRFGKLVENTAIALEDHRITPEERKSIEAEAQLLMGAIGSFLRKVESVSL